jgi:hypothetical protein
VTKRHAINFAQTSKYFNSYNARAKGFLVKELSENTERFKRLALAHIFPTLENG